MRPIMKMLCMIGIIGVMGKAVAQDGYRALNSDGYTAPRTADTFNDGLKHVPQDTRPWPTKLGPVSTETKAPQLQGWAATPHGQVWLEPGRQAYEHDTGLVRDLVTGQRFTPLRATPQATQPQSVYQPYQPPIAPSPVYSPYVYAPRPYPSQPLQPQWNPYVAPLSPYPGYGPGYDYGPYGPSGCRDCGFSLGDTSLSRDFAPSRRPIGSLVR